MSHQASPAFQSRLNPPRARLPWYSGGWQALLVLILMLAVSELILHQQRQQYHNEQRQELLVSLGQLRTLIDTELNSNLYLASGLVSYLRAQNGKYDHDTLEPWIRGLLEQGKYIRNIGIAPENRISYVYPLKGNEQAIGLFYPNLASQWPSVARAIRQRRAILAGPVPLRQGGQGLIFRAPVFLDDGSYWGIVSTVLNADAVQESLRQTATQLHISYALRNLDEDEHPQLSNSTELLDSEAVSNDIVAAGTRWRLLVAPRNGAATPDQRFGYGLAIAVSLLTALLLLNLCRAYRRQTLILQALAESQQRFAGAFETAPQGMALLSPQGQLMECNTTLCQLLGQSANSLGGQSLLELTHPLDQPVSKQMLHALRKGQQRNYQQEKRYRRADGDWIDVWESAALVNCTSGADYLILQIQDLTEFKRMERIKSDFIATISHELRTPLTAVVGALDLVRAGVVGDNPAQLTAMLDIAHDNSQRLTLLIDDLLDMDKLRRGQMRFELRPQRLQPLLENAVTLNQSLLKEFPVQFQLLNHTDVEVEVDSQRLLQVIGNYLSNAAKFSPAQGVIEIESEIYPHRVRVKVRDFGPGVPASFHAHIFQQFSQADSSSRRQQGGTGLGLAICKELIRHMGGDVGFDSIEGLGACFWFELPILVRTDPETPQQHQGAAA